MSRPCRGWKRDVGPSQTLQVKRKSLQERKGTWGKGGRGQDHEEGGQAPCEVTDTQHLALAFRTALAVGDVIPILQMGKLRVRESSAFPFDCKGSPFDGAPHCEDVASWVLESRGGRGGEPGPRGSRAGGESLPALPERESRDSATVGGSAGATFNLGSDAEGFIPRFQFSGNASVGPLSLELLPVGL